MSMGIKIIGIIIIVISFIYLIKNPSQSMMDGLMKQRNIKKEKEQADIDKIEKPADSAVNSEEDPGIR